MTDIISAQQGGYSFLKGGMHPFSGGVACLKGHALTRVHFRAPLPLAEGLAQAAAHIKAQGRPLAALAACELRSPAQMSLADFAAFNRTYVEQLKANGFPSEAPFPMARSNVAPTLAPPSTNTLYAFTYTTTAAEALARPDFLISGKAEIIDEPRQVIAEGDPSPAGTEKKAIYVFAQLRIRVEEIGCQWSDVTGIQIYTPRSLDPVVPLLKKIGLTNVGVTLHPAYPPVAPYEFEVDVRSVSVERVL
jgi:hypothetical protein